MEMDTKEQLVNHIKEWIEIDNGISGLQKQIKQMIASVLTHMVFKPQPS